MNIFNWNCNGGLRNKLDRLKEIDADLFIIQECEDPKRSSKDYQNWAGNYLWYGKNKNKGIGIFPKNNNQVSQLNWQGTFEIKGLNSKNPSTKWSTSDLELFFPFTFNDKYQILAVWTKKNDSESFGYMGQFWKYLQIHRTDLNKENTLIIGDFNSNSIWDQEGRWWNHSDVVQELCDINLESAYHTLNNIKQGKEPDPTFFMRRDKNRPYHIDYIFSNPQMLKNSSLKIGKIKDWINFSDHMPLFYNF